MKLEEGETVLCTVDRIIGTTVFVHIHANGEEKEGSIVMSEIAPGRIRNIRNYVVPKKKIVCKILRISGNRIDLSLRRVTPKEQKEVMEEYKTEKSYISILKTILKDKADAAVEKMTREESLYDFFEDTKSNPDKLNGVVGKENAKKILEIVNVQKQKNLIIKKDISLKTQKQNGIETIKSILGKIKNVEIRYLSAGHYSLKSESSDIKEADTKLKKVLSEIEKNAKKEGMEFSILEK